MLEKLANVPVLNKRVKFPVSPHIPGGLASPEQLRLIAAIAEKYGGAIKIIGGGITIMGLSLADGEAALSELGVRGESFIAQAVRSVAICPGKPHCPMARQDSVALGLELDRLYYGRQTPGKVRLGVSGCSNCCAEVFVKDIGLFAAAEGFTLVVGGNAGRQARVGRIIAEGLPADRIPAIVGAILDYYCRHGRAKERLGDMLDRSGWEEFTANVLPSGCP